MSLSPLVVRSGIGAWSNIAHIITHGLGIGIPPAPPAVTHITRANFDLRAPNGEFEFSGMSGEFEARGMNGKFQVKT